MCVCLRLKEMKHHTHTHKHTHWPRYVAEKPANPFAQTHILTAHIHNINLGPRRHKSIARAVALHIVLDARVCVCVFNETANVCASVFHGGHWGIFNYELYNCTEAPLPLEGVRVCVVFTPTCTPRTPCVSGRYLVRHCLAARLDAIAMRSSRDTHAYAHARTWFSHTIKTNFCNYAKWPPRYGHANSSLLINVSRKNKEQRKRFPNRTFNNAHVV